MPERHWTPVIALLALAACKPAEAPAPAEASGATASAAIASSAAATADEKFIAIGTEPFWNVTIAKGRAVYTTPDNQDGQSIAVSVSQQGKRRKFTGIMDGEPFVLTLRPGNCSDGMSDRSYSYSADLAVAGEEHRGCAEPGTEFPPE
jgi:uncharacterized membrane protein